MELTREELEQIAKDPATSPQERAEAERMLASTGPSRPATFEYDGLIDSHFWHRILCVDELDKIADFIRQTEQDADEWGFAWIAALIASRSLSPARLGLPDDVVDRLEPYKQKFSDRMALGQRFYDENPHLFPGSRDISDEDLGAWMQRVQKLMAGTAK